MLFNIRKLSLPNVRIISTRHANPNLASHAPNVNKTNNTNNSIFDLWIINIKPKVKITPSKAIKHINKLRRCLIKLIKEEITINLTKKEPTINILINCAAA